MLSQYFAQYQRVSLRGKMCPSEILPLPTIPGDDSDPKVMCIRVNDARLTSTPERAASTSTRNERLRLVHHPLPSVPYGIPALLRYGRVEPAESRKPHGVMKGTEQTYFSSWECSPCPW
ncbi:hypothetical protein TNCV_890811 [Trichonephila clavipes]|nr:hypothetical protein TNCV_890811 [Trichonephila clavipes]